MMVDEVKKATQECIPSIGGRDLMPSLQPLDQLYKQTGHPKNMRDIPMHMLIEDHLIHMDTWEKLRRIVRHPTAQVMGPLVRAIKDGVKDEIERDRR